MTRKPKSKAEQKSAESEPAHSTFNDSPIRGPGDDLFGVATFAKALADRFRSLSASEGATIGLNGVWGSGKTSAVNLIKHELQADIAKGEIVIVDFKCWWFQGQEALTLAFLQELDSALKKGLGNKVKSLVPKLARKLLQTGPLVGATVNIATLGVGGELAEKAFGFAERFFSDDESIEGVFSALAEALSKQPKRFLVIIDDIDRLTPDETLQVFRLVKSVGRLPNVMYLLVFDRELAEKAIKERYPSEGPHFLEKIIQASFELPLPPRDELNNAVLAEVWRICGDVREEAMTRFFNIFYDGIAPFITSPRDVVRLANAMSVSWPPIGPEVDLADYLALEVIRLHEQLCTTESERTRTAYAA